MSDQSTNMNKSAKRKPAKSKSANNDTLSFQEPTSADLQKRKFLTIATAAVGAVGALAGATPFVGSMLPSERAKAAGAPVEEDISDIAPGTIRTVEWRGQPVWIINRTDEMTAELAEHNDQLSDPMCEVPQQPVYCKNASRAIKPNIGIVVGLCTHLGCAPTPKIEEGGDMGENWVGGFFCPCHGSKFDLAGRVFKGSPAPTNLVVPPHSYLADGTLVIGVATKVEA